MSSILKALKKIDENSQPPQAFPSLPAAIDAKKAVTRGVKKRWFFRRWFTITLILLATAAAAIILLYRQPNFLARQQTPGSSTAPAVSRKNRPVFRSKIPAPRSDTVIVRSGGQRAAPMPAAAKRAGRKPPRLAANNFKASAGQPRRSTVAVRRTNPGKTAGANKSSLKPKPAFNPPAAAGKAGSGRRIETLRTAAPGERSRRQKAAAVPVYDRLDNSILKLQALAWSDDAARRIAVINGHVIHEGEAVEGYQVTRIRKEDVIVNDGRKSWRLVFGLQH